MFSLATTQSCMLSRIDVRVVEIAVAHLHPDPDRLRRSCSGSAAREIPTRRVASRRSAATADSRTCPSTTARGGTAPGDTTPWSAPPRRPNCSPSSRGLRDPSSASRWPAFRQTAALRSRRTPRSAPTSCRIPARAGCPARRRCRCRWRSQSSPARASARSGCRAP